MDRMTLAAIEAAEASGRLRLCAKGYGLEIVFSDALSDEKRRTMLAFGARITDVRSENKEMTEALIRRMIRNAGEISQRPGGGSPLGSGKSCPCARSPLAA